MKNLACIEALRAFCQKQVNTSPDEAILWAQAVDKCNKLMLTWEPIETAPTDETLFLAGWPDGRMCVMRGSILAAQKERSITPEHLRFECTHWMPLPEPPK